MAGSTVTIKTVEFGEIGKGKFIPLQELQFSKNPRIIMPTSGLKRKEKDMIKGSGEKIENLEHNAICLKTGDLLSIPWGTVGIKISL